MESVIELKKEYFTYVEKIKNEYEVNRLHLISDQCMDEAIIEKIKGNVCEIFMTLFNATERKTKEVNDNIEYETFCQEYIKTFEKIPRSWREKLEKDKENQFYDEVLKEESKLMVVGLLKTKFLELM